MSELLPTPRRERYVLTVDQVKVLILGAWLKAQQRIPDMEVAFQQMEVACWLDDEGWEWLNELQVEPQP